MTRRRARRAAFFDVDGTLLSFSTLWRFLEHQLAGHDATPRDVAAFHASVGELRARAAAGSPREELCREVARLIAGEDVRSHAASGAAWFDAERTRGEVFNLPVLGAFRERASRGDVTVLVSGSFPACLVPICRTIAANFLLCSQPEVREGRYTGHLDEPMIGEAKADAVRRLASREQLDLGASSAYGDHESDVPLLLLVGEPVVVGHDPVLAGRAVAEGWSLLTEAAGPPGRPCPGNQHDRAVSEMPPTRESR